MDYIWIQGAREHNLKNVSIKIPRNQLVVITGVSGSGKSSLAFDTLYAEGQRRYVESLSSYARQFLGRMKKPAVDNIEGLSPAISIDQRGASQNPRSTVGTVTEAYDYLRLLFARIGVPHCSKCGRVVKKQTVDQITDAVLKNTEGARVQILAPVIRHRKGEHREVLSRIKKTGFVRVKIDGKVQDISENILLDKKKWHDIDVVVDRVVVSNNSADRTRIADSVEAALKLAEGAVKVSVKGHEDVVFSEDFGCAYCGTAFLNLEPRLFSFNSPIGACSDCGGLGARLEVDPELVVPDTSLSLSGGAIRPWGRRGRMTISKSVFEALSKKYKFSLDTPFFELTETQKKMILFGTNGETIEINYISKAGRVSTWNNAFEGVINNLQRLYVETASSYRRTEIARYMRSVPCSLCNGRRLRKEALSVTVAGQNIMDVSNSSIGFILEWVDGLQGDKKTSKKKSLNQRELMIGGPILEEISSRMKFLDDIGLGYISLQRETGSLSGGEVQRIRLATQIGSALTGVMYVCDEPSIGLHPVDNDRLVKTLLGLKNLGNTVLVVEHDAFIMRSADYIVDLGPKAGEGGGEVVAHGSTPEVLKNKKSITAQYLSGKKTIPFPKERRTGNGQSIQVFGARENNLKNVQINIPLGLFVCVTGVSGSGKSTLINEVLYKGLAEIMNGSRQKPGECDVIKGIENIDKIVNINQSPIGRTPRSNPATYTGAFTPIRELFSSLPEARSRGYKPGRFSFNVKGGRCEVCEGGGHITIEMQFMPDVTVVCESCNGKRYNHEALEILFKGKSIADILDMSVAEAHEFFINIPLLKRKLQTMIDVGLGYIRLGQPATHLSGGEAQRVKLSTELSRRGTGKTLYVLDEPTTGLSFQDCEYLLNVLHRLVDSGNTVVLIEHNMEIVKNGDWIIDLGPGPGDMGGYVIAEGTPEEIEKNNVSITGKYLFNTN